MKKVSAIVVLSLLAATGCGGAPEESTASSSSEDAITSEEFNAGLYTTGTEETNPDHAEDHSNDAVRPSTSLPYHPQAPDLSGDVEELACHSATGYVRGHASTICVTTVDGHPVEVHTAAAYQRMQAAARRDGVHIAIVSGFRTMAEQRYLYHLYKIGRGNLAAVPGYSNHQSGHALDLNTSGAGVYSWLSRHGAAYGFRRTVPSERWHWEHW